MVLFCFKYSKFTDNNNNCKIKREIDGELIFILPVLTGLLKSLKPFMKKN